MRGLKRFVLVLPLRLTFTTTLAVIEDGESLASGTQSVSRRTYTEVN